MINQPNYQKVKIYYKIPFDKETVINGDDKMANFNIKLWMFKKVLQMLKNEH